MSKDRDFLMSIREAASVLFTTKLRILEWIEEGKHGFKAVYSPPDDDIYVWASTVSKLLGDPEYPESTYYPEKADDSITITLQLKDSGYGLSEKVKFEISILSLLKMCINEMPEEVKEEVDEEGKELVTESGVISRVNNLPSNE